MADDIPITAPSIAATVASTGTVAAATGGAYKFQDRYTEATLAPQLWARLAGRPANGVTPAKNVIPTAAILTPGPAAQVIWVDAGSEILVHLDSVKVKLTNDSLLVSVDLECDQVGRSALIVAFSLAQAGDPAGLLCVTDALPHGNALLAARWGAVAQSAIWAALLGLLNDYSTERNASASAFSATTGVLQLVSDTPASLTIGALK